MFRVVSSSRMSEAVVEQIRTLIRSEELKPGDRLPSERDLGERMGVSRVTVREALRVLEAGGLLQIRVGARGGAFVTTPSSSTIGSGLADLISLSPLTAAEVTEARQIVELGIIPLVVERATEQDIADLREMVKDHQAALRKGEYAMQMSAAFHVRVAACTHNGAIEMLVHSFHGPLLMSLREAQVAAPLMGHKGTAEHREFVEAIAAHDADRAHEIMATHLARTARRVAKVRTARKNAH
ncbi:FadR/GntR family transcriptional regulator [uncultured Jatrophihabitans sp.]|uniref:FadR/GntR family transcriptional regulator n=1 Tax=uncultured Jatrophihabitans sp. TaxID=1610747 RepID=UPI0035C99AF2